ncbi:hypothetical protein WJX82_009622 [Trebouxia sp. C0006]
MQAGLAAGEAVPPEFVDLVKPHVQSFDYFLGDGLTRVVELLEPVEIVHPVTRQTHRIWFESPAVGRPLRDDGGGRHERLFPRDCREAGITYAAALHIDLCYQLEGGGVQRLNRKLGMLPMMVKSDRCYLRHLSRSQLVQAKEESVEMGGYFICNGIERIIRMLIQQRRHYIMALRRSAYHKRGNNYTDAATLIRCVRPDETSATVRCHYLTDGTANFAFTVRRQEFFVPVGILLKCFLEVSDRELSEKLMACCAEGEADVSAWVAKRVDMLLQQTARLGLRSRAACISYLGTSFRTPLQLSETKSDYAIGEIVLRNFVFVHLEQPADKLQLLLAMMHKLYAMVTRQCCDDNPDALIHHEIMLPGDLLCKFMKERLEENLEFFKDLVKRDLDRQPEKVNLQDEDYIKSTSDKLPDVGKKMEYMLNTGNLVSKTGLDISQATGFTVVAEKLNFFRYLSHFRSVHRGAYFAELRTTTVRKLMPEAWGFLCPVHTPDGSPCGLLNHFSAMCRLVTKRPESLEDTETAICMVLAGLGMTPIAPAMTPPRPPTYLTVMLDGKLIGHVRSLSAPALVSRLRDIKAAKLAEEESSPVGATTIMLDGAESMLPSHIEVAYIPFEMGGPQPGLYLFTQAARMMRPVKQNSSQAPELIGSLEQYNMSIWCPDGGVGGSRNLKFTHSEFHSSAMLSVVASLTPYSDYNQSPRNMYQCQMGKQTMGTPAQALQHRADGKLYRIQTPQTPIARTKRYDTYKMDEFPSGMNMMVAVLAYTGYDMEDAMILNKSAVERGLGHATMLKTEQIDLSKESGKDPIFQPEEYGPREKRAPRQFPEGVFGQKFPQNITTQEGFSSVDALKVKPEGPHKDADRVGLDGLPHVGAVVWPQQAYYGTVDRMTSRGRSGKHKTSETAIVDQVTIVGTASKGLQRANIKTRLNRNPVIGDKFSSRHGQKGVLSVLWKDHDMPYCETTGMRPDLIINPHAFPSRMTIGMLVESLTSKVGALNGHFVDATPFQKCEKPDEFVNPIEEFGNRLELAGFAKHGGETMISGYTGEAFRTDIFIGPVYYQRLRHMVSDKFQVRSTGPVNPVTRQPIKGRKFGGGIRFGEMERDALLAHGAAYLLHDRLHTCSDYTVMEICSACGSLLSPNQYIPSSSAADLPRAAGGSDKNVQIMCRVCETGKYLEKVALPYVFRFLSTELAAMNIKCTLSVQQ